MARCPGPRRPWCWSRRMRGAKPVSVTPTATCPWRRWCRPSWPPRWPAWTRWRRRPPGGRCSASSATRASPGSARWRCPRSTSRCGTQGPAARPAAVPGAPGVPRPGAHLRQRRVHQLPAVPAGVPGLVMGIGGDRPDEDQDLTRSRRRPGTADRGTQGGRRRRRAVHRRQRRAEPEGGAVLGGPVPAGVGGVLVRGAGELAGRRGPAAGARPRAGRARRRGRRVRIRECPTSPRGSGRWTACRPT